jgi:pimeloyl-ACP methyl ester carboxylesterase
MLCAEVLPNSEGVPALEALLDEQRWVVTTIVDQARSCEAWQVDPLPPAERQLVTADAPILLLSGALDLNVDPMWAEAAAEALPNGTHLLVPHATHLTTYVPCVAQISTGFLVAEGDLAAVDATCLDALHPPEWR